MRLFREFVSAGLPSPSVPSGNAVAALRLAMGPAPAGSPYHSAWTGVTAESVTAGDAAITVRLSSGTRDATPLAAEQLVWTVQAALGSSLPVHFELADGSTDVAPGHAASTSYTRPSDPMAVLGQVAPIWVDEPARGSVVKAGAPLTVSGVASTFEANVQWQLLREGKVVDSGFTTASQRCPRPGFVHVPDEAVADGRRLRAARLRDQRQRRLHGGGAGRPLHGALTRAPSCLVVEVVSTPTAVSRPLAPPEKRAYAVRSSGCAR